MSANFPVYSARSLLQYNANVVVGPHTGAGRRGDLNEGNLASIGGIIIEQSFYGIETFLQALAVIESIYADDQVPIMEMSDHPFDVFSFDRVDCELLAALDVYTDGEYVCFNSARPGGRLRRSARSISPISC